jgi:O-antigen ligase
MVPVGIAIARRSPRFLDVIFFLLVFGTTQPESLFGLPSDINWLSREWYRGTTRGIEISYLDLLAVILLFGALGMRARERDPLPKLPGFGLMKAYFAWALLAVITVSEPKIFGVFELTKIFRALLLFLAVAAYMRSAEQVRIFIFALVAVVFYESGLALYQRYLLGMHRIYGTLGHPNSLSMYCLQIFPLVLSVWFARDASARLRYLCLLSSVLIAGVILLTISRTGFASLLVLASLAIFLNVRGNWSSRNIAIAFVLAAAMTGMIFKSWDTISSRFRGFDLQEEYLAEGGDRGSYFRLGVPALRDNPISGIGLNNWSYWMTNKYAPKIGDVRVPYHSLDEAPDQLGQNAPAHNLYLLTVVELGLVGLVLFVMILVRWLQVAGTNLLAAGPTFLGRVRIGCFLSLCGLLMQSVTEWIFRQTSILFLAHMVMGVAVFILLDRSARRVRSGTSRQVKIRHG